MSSLLNNIPDYYKWWLGRKKNCQVNFSNSGPLKFDLFLNLTLNAGIAYYEGYAPFHKFIGKRYNIDPGGSHLVSTGATSLFSLVMNEEISTNSAVIFDVPTYPLFFQLAEKEGKKIGLSFRSSYDIFDINSVEEQIRLNGKSLIVLLNPSNPYGTPFKESEIDEIVNLAEEMDCRIFVDETYREGTNLPSFIPKTLESNKVYVATGYTKNPGLEALRAGVVISHPSNISKLKLKRIWEAAGSPFFLESALLYILSEHNETVESYILEQKEKMSCLRASLHTLKYVSGSPNLQTISLPGQFENVDLAESLYTNGIFTVPASFFWLGQPPVKHRYDIRLGLGDLIPSNLKNPERNLQISTKIQQGVKILNDYY